MRRAIMSVGKSRTSVGICDSRIKGAVNELVVLYLSTLFICQPWLHYGELRSLLRAAFIRRCYCRASSARLHSCSSKYSQKREESTSMCQTDDDNVRNDNRAKINSCCSVI